MTSKRNRRLGKVILFTFLFLIVIVASGLGYIRYFKPDVGKAPQLKIVSNPQMIERGRYLANHVMACIDCHSSRDFSQFAGPMLDGTAGKGGDKFGPEVGFPGTFYAPNITPAALKSWTDGEIFRTITTGVSRNGEPVFPVMPYHYYGKADSADIIAVIAYLRTLPAVENKVPASNPDFPISLIMRTMPAKANLQTKPDTANKIAYGEYLVTTAACMDCHTQVDKGTLIAGLEFAGGRQFDIPGGQVASANITPDTKTGLGGWNAQMFISRFAQFRDKDLTHRRVKPGEFNTIMPWTMYAGMKDSDLKAIYAYLKTLKPIKNQVVKFTPKG